MGLTSALNTALNGLSLNETAIDVLGNNIANAGTNGFKASEVLFESQLARTLSVGSRPTDTNGGTNPRQIGLGASVSAIRKDFSQGSVTNSTSPSDLAIQGDGFFILSDGEGDLYTRAGNFALNSANLLISPQGFRVQGYGVTEEYELITTTTTDITIPIGLEQEAQITRNVSIEGSLFPNGTVGTLGSVVQAGQLVTTAAGNPAAAGASLLTDVRNAGDVGTQLFSVGQTLTFSPRKGERTLNNGDSPATLTVDAATTVTDLMEYMEDVLGIHDTADNAAIPQVLDEAGNLTNPGISITGGVIEVVGNQGVVNDISIVGSDLVVDNASSGLVFTKAQAANGESAITDFVVFDSLGQPVQLKMTAVLVDQTSTQTTFRWFIDSEDNAAVNFDTALANGSGEIVFDSDGQVVDGGTPTITVERTETAALSQMPINLDLRALSGISSETAGSTINLGAQDGSDPGTLTSFVIDEGGIVNGVFDNGIIRTLGQVVLARFPNPQGLVESGSTTFQEGISSGARALREPGEFGSGTIRAGAVELSNTDIGAELIDLITASTNYRGNARVISSVQELTDELLVLGR